MRPRLVSDKLERVDVLEDRDKVTTETLRKGPEPYRELVKVRGKWVSLPVHLNKGVVVDYTIGASHD